MAGEEISSYISSMFTKNIIIKNFVSLAASELISKAIAILSTAYLARTILPEGYGIIGFSIAVVTYLITVVTFGNDTIVVRDLSRDHSKLSDYFSSLILFRILLTISVLFLFYLIAPLLAINNITENVLKIISLSLFIHALSSEFIMQATEKMEIIAFSNISKSILLLVGYYIFVHETSDIQAAAWVFSLSGILISFLFTLYVHNYISKFHFKLDVALVKYLLKESFPLIVSVLAISIYYNMDLIMLGYIKTDFEVGIYNSAYRIFLLGILPSGILLKVFLPKLSKVIKSDKESFWKTITNYSISLIGFAVLTSAIIFFGGHIIISLVYGPAFSKASNPLTILSMNILIVAVNVSLGNPLTVWGMQKLYTITVLSGAVANIVLNFILIPIYSYNGAALATLLSELIVFIGVAITFNMIVLKRIAKNEKI